MTPEALIAIGTGLVVGSGLGFVLGRFAGGGWLFGFSLLLGLPALGMLSSDVLEAIGIPREGFNHLGYFAFSMLVLMPALAGAILFGGIGLWRASRLRGGPE
jgi:hypothetical protein